MTVRQSLRALALALATTALAGGALPAAAQQAVPAAVQACVACHGAEGISQMPGVPSLAGQPEGFLQWQLVFFRNGVRHNPVMEPIAGALKDDDIRVAAGFFAKKPPAPLSSAAVDGDAVYQAGLKLVRANRCAACHKDDFSGGQAAGRLAGQREEYLLKALRDYKAGARTGGGVAQMADVVYPLGDEDLKTLAHTMALWRPGS